MKVASDCAKSVKKEAAAIVKPKKNKSLQTSHMHKAQQLQLQSTHLNAWCECLKLTGPKAKKAKTLSDYDNALIKVEDLGTKVPMASCMQ